MEVELRASNRQDKAANENLKRHKILTTVGLSLLLILVRSLASSLSRQFNLFKLLWLVLVKVETGTVIGVESVWSLTVWGDLDFQ